MNVCISPATLFVSKEKHCSTEGQVCYLYYYTVDLQGHMLCSVEPHCDHDDGYPVVQLIFCISNLKSLSYNLRIFVRAVAKINLKLALIFIIGVFSLEH